MVFAHSRDSTDGTANYLQCIEPAITKFPNDIFTHEQRIHGAVCFHVFVAIYLFVALAIVCDKYFVPAVEKISEALNMSADVAGATVMAAASSAPELFVNAIGTFITKGDIGVGTIVGSAVFNILAVTACCGLFSPKPVSMEWWPLTRDCTAYLITVVTLFFVELNQKIYWYEALILVSMYIVYITAMCYDRKIQKILAKFCKTNIEKAASENNTSRRGTVDACKETQTRMESIQENGVVNAETANTESEEENEEPNMLGLPSKRNFWNIIIWIVILPINIVLVATVPDSNRKRFKNWYPITFLFCVVWIAIISYVICWMITIIGDTLKIPDSVMGITFLALGSSVPEAASTIVVSKLGRADMGISSSLGSNTFDILLCLGLPWLLKSLFMSSPNEGHAIYIKSQGIQYTAAALLVISLLFYCVFAANKFKLDKKVACICLVIYAVFLVLATLTELNIFGEVNPPTCSLG